MGNRNQRPKTITSKKALFKYQVISQVLAAELKGDLRADAIREAVERAYVEDGTRLKMVSARSIYRWLEAYKAHGLQGLAPSTWTRTQTSEVIAQDLLLFFEEQKQSDPRISIPELIRRARQQEKLAPNEAINRVSVWRALKRMGVETTRRRQPSKGNDCRRFSFPHRLDMVLCDGKHFRAGDKRHKRVALFFLDDATRMGLGVVVGPSESTALFLRGLYECLMSYGAMSALYTDHGCGFVAHDSVNVLAKLRVLFIHGSVGYPQARGKVERFNRTASEHVLRGLDKKLGLDSSCAALELRLRHYLFEQYNHTPHESLKNDSPWSVFHQDAKALRFFESEKELRRRFILTDTRRVSDDHIISYDGIPYEVPKGYAGSKILLQRHILDDYLAILHEGRMLRLSQVDPHANARSTRSTRSPQEQDEAGTVLPPSSADMAFERDYGPLVTKDGDFPQPPQE